MEEIADNNPGIVNQGFSVDFSSEDSGSDVDNENLSKLHLKPTKADNLTSSNMYEPPGSCFPDGSKSGSISSPAGTEKIVSNFIHPSGTELSKFPKKTNIEKNVQTSNTNTTSSINMDTTDNFVMPSQILNKMTNPGEEKVLSIIGNGNNSPLPKEYFRDVRLSLGSAKPISNGLPFQHTNGKESFRNSSRNDHNGNSFCDSCKSRVLTNYKIAFKYLFERPLFCFSIWAIFYILWGDAAKPGGSLFALTVLELSALFLGYIAEQLQLPGLLGMLAAGLILRNVPHINVAKDFDSSLSSPLRALSIVILLIRGGLSVNLDNIIKFKNIIPPLVIGSCVLEAIAATIAVYCIIGFPLEWAALTGCIISALSGVAVLPYLTSTEKLLAGKPDPYFLSPNYQKVICVAKTACGLDAILAICMAEVALGFIFAEGNTRGGIMKGIVEVLYGGAFGIVWGFLVAFLLDETSGNEKRVIAVFAGGTMSLLGMSKIGVPRGGPLGVFLGTVIVATVWKKKEIGGVNNEQLSASFTLIWVIFQPLLFSIIGARTEFEKVDWSVVSRGLACLAISLCVRLITSFFMTSWGNLSIKERLYICLAWIPKGTVQAALGPVAVDTALDIKDLKSPDIYNDLGLKVMNIAAFTIIAAATVGSFLLRFIGPRLLIKQK